MNVLNIQKQNNHVLRFSPHALKRAHERDVPIPKYIPFNSRLIKYDFKNEDLCFHLAYKFSGIEYLMIVSETNYVVTLYPMYELSSQVKIRNVYNKYMASKESEGFISTGDLICLDYETDYYVSQQCA